MRGSDDFASVESVDGGLIATAAVEIVHGDIDVDLPTRRLDTQDHGFGVDVAGEPFFAHMNFRRKYLEAEALIVQQRNRVADDHVCQFTYVFANDLLALLDRRARQLRGD